MVLLTDLTSATDRALHPGQHNEVNQEVLDLLASIGQADGLATLDGDGYVVTTQLPPTAFTVGSQEVASQVEQLALDVPRGFIAVRTDENKTYIRGAGTAGTMADWTWLRTPTDVVLSVNGENGAITLDAADVGAQPADADLTAIGALTPAADDVLQRKAGAWINRTPAELLSDLAIPAPPTLDQDLLDIAALAPANDDLLQRKAGAWVNRTPAQVLTDLGISGPTFVSSYKWGVDF